MPFQFYCPQGHLLEGHESQMGQQSQCPICGGVFVIPMAPGMPGPPQGWSPGFAPQPPAYYPPQVPGGPPGVHPGYVNYPGGFQPGMYPPGSPAGGFPGAPAAQQAWPGYQPAPGQQAYPGAAVMQPNGMAYPEAMPAAQAPTGFPDFQIQTEPAAAPAEQAVSAQPAEEAKPEPPPEKQEPRIVRIPCPQGHELQTPMDMVAQDVLCPICSTQFHLRYEDSIEFKEEQAELQRRKAERVNQAALKWSIGAAIVVVLGILTMIIYLAFTAPAEPARNEPVHNEPIGPADTNKPSSTTTDAAQTDTDSPESTEGDVSP